MLQDSIVEDPVVKTFSWMPEKLIDCLSEPQSLCAGLRARNSNSMLSIDGAGLPGACVGGSLEQPWD